MLKFNIYVALLSFKMVIQKGCFINPACLCFQAKISTRPENKAIHFGNQNRNQNTNKP